MKRTNILGWVCLMVMSFLVMSLPLVWASSHQSIQQNLGSSSFEEVPGFIWEETYGGPNWEWCRDMIEISTGGFAMTGFTDPTGSTNGGRLWLVRVDEDGTQLWNRTYTDDESGGHSLVECSSGGFAMAGALFFSNPLHQEMLLVRTDVDGNHLWNRTYYGSASTSCFDMIECSDGGFALLGWQNIGDDSDLILVRTDADGNQIWNQTYGFDGNEYPGFHGLTQCSDGGFALAGDTWSFNSDAQLYVVRTDSTGNELWNLTLGETGFETATSIVTVGSELQIVAQRLDSVQQLSLVWLIRIDTDGAVVWERTYGSANHMGIAESMIQCSTGGFALAGFGGDPFSQSMGAWLLRIDDNGNLLWDQIYDRSDRDEIYAIVECSDGGFALAGQTEVDWSEGDFDFWLLRVADEAPPIPIEWIVAGVGVPIVVIVLAVVIRARRK
ncbi:MAG: PQQ-binding-like beta-propeller repeat protein [Candidatus Hermodarchaeota archaeon]